MQQTKSIGLVGGIASGKSFAAKILVEMGAVLLDADRTGHAVLDEDADVRQAILRRWGDSVVATDGKIDRAVVARRVFAKNAAATEDRRFLEELLHPRIGGRLNEQRQRAAASGKPAVVLDAPLLLEAGWKSLCDVVVMIDSGRDLRLKRAALRGWSEAEFDQREAAQMPIEEKRRLADVVIPNDGSTDDLRQAIADFWGKYIAKTSQNV